MRERYLKGALLNLVPGLGLGYLMVRRRRAFLVCLLGWLAALVVGTVLGNNLTGVWCEFFECRAGASALLSAEFTLVLAFIFVNIPAAVHLLALGMRDRQRR